jgi:acyl-CoA thioesterase I
MSMLKMCISYLGLLILMLPACGTNKTSEEKNTQKDSPQTAAKDSTVVPSASVKNIVFFGNSLTAGYGVDPTDAFPALIQNKVDSLHIPYKVINAGLSGETTAGGNSRIDWILRQPIDVFILELGGNDGLRGIPISETTKNLQNIITKVKAKYPAVKLVLAGMQIPPNIGARYADEFRQVFRELADKNNVLLIPFILEGVGGVPDLNQGDGIHPTVQGHKIVAENVWKVIKDIL